MKRESQYDKLARLRRRLRRTVQKARHPEDSGPATNHTADR